MQYFFDKVFPPLLGTLVGASLAFFVKRLQDKSDEKKKRIEAANYSLFVLVQQTNDLIQTERVLSEWRPEERRQTRWIEMKPVLGFTEQLPLRTENLNWLLATEHRNLLGRYMAARNGHLTVMGLIEQRKQIKGRVDDHLEREITKAGLPTKENSLISSDFLDKILSGRQVVELTQSAENLLEFNVSILVDHFEVIEQLHAAFKKIWPKESFIKLEPKEDLLNRYGLILQCPSPTSEAAIGPRIHRFEVN